jgi:hypothetical protein
MGRGVGPPEEALLERHRLSAPLAQLQRQRRALDHLPTTALGHLWATVEGKGANDHGVKAQTTLEAVNRTTTSN